MRVPHVSRLTHGILHKMKVIGTWPIQALRWLEWGFTVGAPSFARFFAKGGISDLVIPTEASAVEESAFPAHDEKLEGPLLAWVS